MLKRTSKMIAVACALLMVLTMAATAFAAETPGTPVLLQEGITGEITMAGAADGDTFYVYQIMEVAYDNDTNEMTYTPSAKFVEFLASDKNTQKATIDTFDKYAELESESDAMKRIVGEYSAYCKDPGVTEDGTISGNNTLVVPLGQYVINGVSAAASSTTTPSVFSVMTASFPVSIAEEGDNAGKYVVVKDVQVNVKKNNPTLDKSIPDDITQYAIGEFVDYSIITTVPSYPIGATRKTYTIGDKCDNTLTIDYDGTHGPAANPITGIVVKGSKTDTAAASFVDTLTAGDHYTLAEVSGQEFLLTFDYDKIAEYKAIQVLYYAEVNKNAIVTTPLENTATFTYSTDPYDHNGHDESLEDKEKVYTYGIELTKVDAASVTDPQTEPLLPIPGVEFKLYAQGQTTPISFVVSGTDYKVADADATPGATVTTLVTDANGKINIIGLDVGQYELEETKAATGYALPDARFSITITDAERDGKIDTDDKANGVVEYMAENAKSTTTLPQTGGVGTVLFICIGLAGMVIAVVLFAILNKKSKNIR